MPSSTAQIFPVIGIGSIPSPVAKVQATIDFGTNDTTASVTITGQPWVGTNSVIIAGFGNTTTQHDYDDALVEGLTAYVENIVPGVGFDITVYAPLSTWGQYGVYAIGVI